MPLLAALVSGLLDGGDRILSGEGAVVGHGCGHAWGIAIILPGVDLAGIIIAIAVGVTEVVEVAN